MATLFGKLGLKIRAYANVSLQLCQPGDTETKEEGQTLPLVKFLSKSFYPKLRDTASWQPPATGRDHKIIDEFGG